MGERTQFMIGFARLCWRGWGGGSRGKGRDTGGPVGIWDGEVTISQCLHFSKPEFSPGCNFCFAVQALTELDMGFPYKHCHHLMIAHPKPRTVLLQPGRNTQ